MTTPPGAPHGTGLPDASLRRVVQLVQQQHAEPLTVADLADEAGYSPFHFSRLFASAVGVPPGQYLVAHRIDSAKRLLLAGDDAVVDVATAVGFDSLSSFSRRFRQTVGVPPAALRRLAHTVADRPARPFRLLPPGPGQVRVEATVPDHVLASGAPHLWLGWYPQPAPIGLPAGGLLAELGQPTALPLSPGAPWLLGFLVEHGAGVVDQLAPSWPVVALHPTPLVRPVSIRLDFSVAPPGSVPLLTALPSLCRSVRG